MDRNSVLAVVLSTLVFITWATYQAQQSAQRVKEAPEVVESVERGGIESSGAPDGSIAPDSESPAPMAEAPPTESPAAARPGEGETAAGTPSETPFEDPGDVAEWRRRLELGPYSVEVTNRGATLTSWVLSEFDERTPAGPRPVEMVSDVAGAPRPLATPFAGLGMGDLSNARFAVTEEADDRIAFVWQHQGVRVEKTIAFDAEDYGFTMTVAVRNGTDRPLAPTFGVAWPIHATEVGEFSEPGFAVLQDGSVERERISARGFFGRSGVDEPVSYEGEIDWAALEDKYFVRALLPDRPRNAKAGYRPIEVAQTGVMTVGFEPVELPPGQSVEHEFHGYVGPKRAADLATVSPSLELTINRGYAFVQPLTRFFEWALHACYTIVPNYGLAIILLTLLVRLVTAPIMSKQVKSMERMRAVHPMLKEIQEKYADDRQKQSEEMMALYKREGVNPLGGCLPMLLQFPVFIGLFFALQSSFDLRHAGFVFWINDLSAPETLFTVPGLDLPIRLLPLIMGASMVVQQRLTPTTADPAQARMMMTIMPIMFTVLFYQFPSGLVLYWLVSNLLGIAHQLWVGRKLRQ